MTNSLTWALPEDLGAAVSSTLREWTEHGRVARLWAQDSHLWRPRFLHSTSQAYKGGPNSGVFLQITADDARDLPVPGQRYSFGIVKAAQARGDLEVLAARGRRALRAHLGADVAAGLRALGQAMEQATS